MKVGWSDVQEGEICKGGASLGSLMGKQKGEVNKDRWPLLDK